MKEYIRLFSDNYAEKLNAGEDVRFTTFGNFTNGANNPLEMLEKAIAVIEDGEKRITAEYSGKKERRILNDWRA